MVVISSCKFILFLQIDDYYSIKIKRVLVIIIEVLYISFLTNFFIFHYGVWFLSLEIMSVIDYLTRVRVCVSPSYVY